MFLSWWELKKAELVKKNCNGSASVVANDVIGNLMESLYNYMLIKGDDYQTLPKYLEATEHRYEVLKETGFSLASESLRDAYMEEEQRRNTAHNH